MAVFLGLVAALVYGASDFCGGLATKRAAVLRVLLVAQATGLICSLIGVTLDRADRLTTSALVTGGISGLVAVVGLGLLYTALAQGSMSAVAPIAAATGALVPVIWGFSAGEKPSLLALVGVLLALGSVVVISGGEESLPPVPAGGGEELDGAHAFVSAGAPNNLSTGIALAGAAGLCFGAVFVILANVEATNGFWPLVGWRVISIPILGLLVLITRPEPKLERAMVPLAILTGVTEVLGNAAYLVAARHGLISLVGVLGSLYPAGTVLLAWIVLKEHVSRVQIGGIAMAGVGVVLIASG